MSSAQETINKLSEALNTLITAYEELQNVNSGLKNTITELKEDKEKILQENSSLQNNVSVLSDSTEQQNSSMYNMLDKIESLLGSDFTKEIESNEKEEFPAIHASIDESESLPLDELELESIEPEKDKKIDLDRMASMLNGFNK